MTEFFFRLARRGRQPYDENRPTIKDLNEMENRIMAALEDAVNALNEAITEANNRFQNVGSLESALAEERSRYEALVASEEAEDVQQNQDLQDARAATDAALSELRAAEQSITLATEQVQQLGTVAAEQPAAEAPAPDTGTEATAAPAAAEGTETAPEGGADAAADTGDTGDAGTDAGGDTADTGTNQVQETGTDNPPPQPSADAVAESTGEDNDPASTRNMNPNV